MCAPTSFTAGDEKTIQKTDCGGQFDKELSPQYDVYKIEGNTLYFGKEGSSTAEARPSSVDSSTPFTKK